MTNFLHWRRMRWGLVLWGGYVVLWMVAVGSGVAIAILWWLTGVIVFGSLWLATQPRLRPGRSIGGVFIRPGWTDWRFLNLHRPHPPGEPRAGTLRPKSDALRPPEHR